MLKNLSICFSVVWLIVVKLPHEENLILLRKVFFEILSSIPELKFKWLDNFS